MSRPNIIFLMADQMRFDAYGASGNSLVHTPYLDSLAGRGTVFSAAYSAVPSCIPARSILWTGMNQWHTGILGMGRGQGPMPADFPHTLAGELSAAGYRTHLVGKAHFHPQRALLGFQSAEIDESGRVMPPQQDDFRTWFYQNAPRDVGPDDHGVGQNSWLARPWHTDEHLHPSAWTMTRAVHFLRERDRSQPFFLNISFARPHSPYVPPRPFWDMYDGAELPEPYVGDWAAMNDVPDEASDHNAWRGKMSPTMIRRARAGYYGEISFIDAQVGKLMNWIERYDRELLANTWFVFTSDHGDMQGDHHLWRKTYAYEGSSHVPFFITPPRGQRPARRTADEAIELQDFMPTVLDIAGLGRPRTVDGRSLVPLLQSPAADWRPYIHGEHCQCYHPNQEMHYLTDGRQKFVWLPRLGVEQFFDLAADPGECRDLVNNPSRQDDVISWRSRLFHELDQRQCGWTKAGRPCCPGDAPMVSPYLKRRWQGA